MIEPAGGIVRRNVAIDQPSLAPVFNLNVGFADADLSGADRFNFRPLKRQPGFVRTNKYGYAYANLKKPLKRGAYKVTANCGGKVASMKIRIK